MAQRPAAELRGVVHSRPNLPAVTAIRFLAAMHVYVLHSTFRPGYRWGRLFDNGAAAVSFFFVLSGFVLAYNYLEYDRLVDRRRFWIARVARIYPVYLLGLVASIPAFISNPHPFGHSLVMMAMVIVASLALVQAWSLATANAVNGVAWSLSVEAFFYSVFPAIGERIQRRPSRTIVAWAAMAWLVAMIAVALLTFGSPLIVLPREVLIRLNWILGPEFNPVMRLPEFVVGIVVGCVFLRKTRGWGRSGVFWDAVSVAALVACCLAYAWSYPSPLMHNGLLVPLYVVLIVALARGGPVTSRVLGNRVAVRLGELSYALYLLHLPIAQVYDRMAIALGFPGRDVGAGFALRTLLTIACSYAVLVLVEEPARRAVLKLSFRV